MWQLLGLALLALFAPVAEAGFATTICLAADGVWCVSTSVRGVLPSAWAILIVATLTVFSFLLRKQRLVLITSVLWALGWVISFNTQSIATLHMVMFMQLLVVVVYGVPERTILVYK